MRRRHPHRVAELEFIDSSGIGLLVNAYNIDKQGRRLRIVNMTQIGRRAIEAVGLVDLLGVTDTNSDPYASA